MATSPQISIRVQKTDLLGHWSSWAIVEKSRIVGYGPHRIFEVNKIYTEGRVAGWGNMLMKDEFINRFLATVLADQAVSDG